jgi:hypothetical protein
MKSCMDYEMRVHSSKVLSSEVASIGHTPRTISRARCIKHGSVTILLLNPFVFITYTQTYEYTQLSLSLVSSLMRTLTICGFSSKSPNNLPLLVSKHVANIRPILTTQLYDFRVLGKNVAGNMNKM